MLLVPAERRCLKPGSGQRTAARLFISAVAVISTSFVYAQSESFDTGTDTGWLRSSDPPATFSFPADAFGGHAYRLQALPADSGSDTNARAMAYLTNRLYTNFFAAVDVVAWNTNQDCNLVVGLLARASSNEVIYPGAPFDPSRPMGLTFNARLHNNRSYLGPTNSGPLGHRDQMSAWGMVNANGTLMLGNPVTVSEVGFRWEAGHVYRLVLSCTNKLGDPRQFYTSSIYDANDLTKPLLTMTGDDSYAGNNLYIPPYGYVGVFGYHLSNGDYDPNVDVTFDNFYAAESAPTSVASPGIPHGLIGAPQVVDRSPVSFKNFHPAASGISFTATTLTTTNEIKTSAIKLFLNGVDVSSGLVVSSPSTNVSVSYSGLASNTVYDARIELEDAPGRRTTNCFVFDTFSDAYLASTAVKTIECEDYDFNGGSFFDDPPPSGWGTDGVGPYNGGAGYVETIGTSGVDFFDRDSSPHAGEAQYRSADPVGTQQGNYGAFVWADAVQTIGYSQSYDTQRAKYAAVYPLLQDYIVERTEGGEWLNYTRVFDGARYYNAYLRAAAGLAQPVRLDSIAAGPVTNALGRFEIPSTFYLHNYRYTPLLAADGSRAIVNLSGTNTVRLTMDGPANEATKNGLALNYMILVPAEPQVLSASQANGNYVPEANALVDAAGKRITVPRTGETRFYRIQWTQPVTITGISLTSENVSLTYQ